MKRLIALAAASLAPMVSMAQVTNGSFEDPPLMAGDSIGYPLGSTTITGWEVIGGSDVQLVTSTFLSGSGYDLSADTGSQWVDLTGTNEGANKGLTTTFASVIGQAYTLNFALGRLLNRGAASVDVLLDGTPYTFSTLSSANGTATMSWDHFSIPFIGDGSTSLAFTGNAGGDTTLVGLDSVAVVPEPGTLALAMLGALGLCAALQLRRPS